MVDNADYRVNATDGAVRPTPLTDKKNREKKEPSRKRNALHPKRTQTGIPTLPLKIPKQKPNSDHLVDYYA